MYAEGKGAGGAAGRPPFGRGEKPGEQAGHWQRDANPLPSISAPKVVASGSVGIAAGARATAFVAGKRERAATSPTLSGGGR